MIFLCDSRNGGKRKSNLNNVNEFLFMQSSVVQSDKRKITGPSLVKGFIHVGFIFSKKNFKITGISPNSPFSKILNHLFALSFSLCRFDSCQAFLFLPKIWRKSRSVLTFTFDRQADPLSVTPQPFSLPIDKILKSKFF